MARVKVNYKYDKDRQMYRCDKDDKEICKNCIHWKCMGIEGVSELMHCSIHMDSISEYMSCDKFIERQ